MKSSPSSTPSHRKAEACRKAAQMVEQASYDYYSCCALDTAQGWVQIRWSPLTEKYRNLFSEREGGFLSIAQFQCEKNCRDLRVLALCFMAAITENP